MEKIELKHLFLYPLIKVTRRVYKTGDIVSFKALKDNDYIQIIYGREDWWGIYINDKLITHKETKSSAKKHMELFCKVYEIGYK